MSDVVHTPDIIVHILIYESSERIADHLEKLHKERCNAEGLEHLSTTTAQPGTKLMHPVNHRFISRESIMSSQYLPAKHGRNKGCDQREQ